MTRHRVSFNGGSTFSTVTRERAAQDARRTAAKAEAKALRARARTGSWLKTERRGSRWVAVDDVGQVLKRFETEAAAKLWISQQRPSAPPTSDRRVLDDDEVEIAIPVYIGQFCAGYALPLKDGRHEAITLGEKSLGFFGKAGEAHSALIAQARREAMSNGRVAKAIVADPK